jgi:glycosyltransferase involved in cell wall biosynthesis
MKVAIISTHPIQYHIPWYRELAKRQEIALTVYYALIPDKQQQGSGFDIPFEWDIPLFEGYRWEILKNSAKKPSLNGFFCSSTPSIFSVLAKAKPNIVIITGWNALPLLQALLASIWLRIPRIVRGESNALRKRKWYIRVLHRILLHRYDAFLAIGKANNAFYIQYGISKERIFTCNYFVDNERFKQEADNYQKDQNNVRNDWNIPKEHVCFIYAGKLEAKKRIMDLLQAMELASKKRQDIHLLVVGDGELMEQAEQFTVERRLPVTFAGFLNQTQISRAYVAADCLVLPSDYGETWGLVVNEGMVCGLPAIVSDRVGCAPDLVKNRNTGYIFPFGDIEALAQRLVWIASDNENRLMMGANAKQLIQEYSVEKAVEGTLQAIEFVLDRNIGKCK